MKAKIALLLITSCLLALSAWLVRAPSPVRADEPVNEVPAKYRETVNKGLEYLAKNQLLDGYWEGDGGKHPVAMTALVGMAFLMEGSNIHKGKYSANVRKAVDWLMARSQAKRDGLIFSDHPSETDRYMYGHGLATQFLSWAYGNDIDKAHREELEGVLTRAVKYIIKARSTQGGWYRTSRVEGHDLDEVAATAIQIQALYMAGNLGVGARSDAASDGQEYLKRALAKYEKDGKPMQNGSQVGDTAAALVCRSGPDAHSRDNDALCKKWFKFCQNEIPVGRVTKFGRDELTQYYYGQAIYNDTIRTRDNMMAPGPSADVSWASYRSALFDQLQSSQSKDGSWPPGDGLSVGSLYSTALWCTVLQLDTRHHPLTRLIIVNQF